MNSESITISLPAGDFFARTYRRDDEERVLDLWRIAFEKDLPVEIWRWKYADNPFGNRILLSFAPDSDEAIVMYSGVPYRSNWNGRTVEMVQLMDIMSHPDCRKTGLFVKSAEVFFDTFAGGDSILYYGIPGKYHFEIGAKYLAYSGLDSGVGYLEGEIDRISRLSRFFGGRLDEVHEVGPDFDGLWRDLARNFPLAVIRDGAFLRWRFVAHTQRTYSIFAYRRGISRRLGAYAVVGFDGETANMVDFLMPPEHKAGVDFFTRLAAQCKIRGSKRIVTWVPGNHFAGKILAAAGFSEKGEPLGIVPTARSFDPELEIPWVSDNLFYTMADSDLL